jgi:dCMP deaminase
LTNLIILCIIKVISHKKENTMEKDANYYIGLAHAAAEKSTSPTTKVGCVIVKDREILGTGRNDFPEGMDPAYITYEKPAVYSLLVHAEMWAILNATKSVAGATLYVTHASCENCLKHIIQAKVKEIVYDELYTGSKIIKEPSAWDTITRLIKSSNFNAHNLRGENVLNDYRIEK